MSSSQTIILQHAVATTPQASMLEWPYYTVDELIKHRASELDDFPLIAYPKEGLLDFEEHSARAIDKYIDTAVVKLQKLGLKPVNTSNDEAPVVAILAQSSLHVIITMLGLSRLGYAVLFLSTRLASPAIVRLLELSNCNDVVTTPIFHPVLAEVQRERQLTLIPLLERSDYYAIHSPVFHRSYDAMKEYEKIAFVIHSSGSTGLPKPIFLTHRSCLATFATNLGMTALLTSPLFHSHGFYETFRSIYSKKTIYLCNYALPLTKQSLISMIQHVKPELLHCVPYVLKLIAESHEGIRCLSRVKTVLFGGSSCPDDLGSKLVKNGVNLVGNYGATETGRLMNSVRPAGDNAWDYLRFLSQVKKYVLMDEIAPGVYECVALDGLKSKSTINSNNPPNSFRTRDLFTRHPSNPDFWKYLSRLDDRLTLINGEKVLPLPIEGRIRQEEYIREAAVFGAGRSFPGVLIFRAEKGSHLCDQEFFETIWPAVEAANARAESFSRIPKELVVVMSAKTTYPRTDKGTFIRAQVYSQFEQEIEAVYQRFETGKGGTLAFEVAALEEYLLRKFREDLDIKLESHEVDFFASGIDSLQCIKMWNIIRSELDLGGQQSKVSQNILYEKGNVASLAQYLYDLRVGDESEKRDDFQTMRDLISKYSSFDRHVPGSSLEHNKELVLVTGATGALGAHLLAQLTREPNVSTVWALVRAKNSSAAMERVLQSLSMRGLQLSLLERSKIIALASDLSQPDFGLEPSVFSELKTNITLVIHSAWAVNFNIPVQSFENQHIKAVHNLIQACLSTPTAKPARFYFCSSVSAAGGKPRPGFVHEGPVADITHAQNTGYARSKFVAENVVQNAAKDAKAHARVLRVGQLVGDSNIGVWNTTEGIPLMIQTAITLEALPALDEEMTWLPVDYAATAILELTGIIGHVPDRTADAELTYHVLNPTRFHWTRDMIPALAAAGLKFKLLPQKEWLEKLRTSEQDPVLNPPIKLFDWFAGKYGGDETVVQKGVLAYLTEATRTDSETLRNLPDVTRDEFVQKLVGGLRKSWENIHV